MAVECARVINTFGDKISTFYSQQHSLDQVEYEMLICVDMIFFSVLKFMIDFQGLFFRVNIYQGKKIKCGISAERS